ncbi:MAG TPA: MBL fold metallo-hydrolase [Polyangiales bacterium]|nr:MBL fold metallo-hydrolase [Polyangiales bacterium]
MKTRRILKWLALGLLGVLLLGVGFVVVQLNRRPSLEPYAARGLQPAAADAPVRVRFAGVATLLFDDGETRWMTDGFFSRPALTRVAFSRIEPDRAGIQRGLSQLAVDKLAAVVPMHSHYDHAMDSPLVAMQTGAQLIGSESTLNVGRGLGMPEDRMRKVSSGESVTLGRWRLTFLASRHVPLPNTRSVVTIDAPLVPPAHASAWGEGQTWTLAVEHASGARLLILGSAGFIAGSLEGRHADTVLLGVGTLGRQSREYRAQLWQEAVRRVGARRVIPIHWDDFGRGLDRPLVAFPYLVDDVAATLEDLSSWAARDHVEMRMPPLFTPFSP